MQQIAEQEVDGLINNINNYMRADNNKVEQGNVQTGKVMDDLTDLENQLNNIGSGANERNTGLGQEVTGERGKLVQSVEKSEE